MQTQEFKRWLMLSVLICPLALTACGGDSDSTTTDTSSDTTTDATGDGGDTTGDSGDTGSTDDTDDDTDVATGETAITDEDVTAYGDVWVLNADGERALNMNDGAGNFPLVDVTGIGEDETGEYLVVQSTNIPSYETELTQRTIDYVTGRPDPDIAFTDGVGLSVSAGDTVHFGDNIGFVSNDNCVSLGGYGYWPHGPVCPEEQDFEVYLPLEPTEGDGDCDTGISQVGITVNGVAIFNWSDGMSYNNEGVWQNVVGAFEKYDVDICGGHAANGAYHHHTYSQCIAEIVGDDGSGHSSIHGYAADGYPIYGPHQASDVLAKSCWMERSYLADADTGCSNDTERTCQLVDNKDVAAGTEEVSSGPTTDDFVMNLGRTFEFQAVSGIYYEDYYYSAACTAQGEAYLDQYNGHDTGDGRGYHYHMTVEEDMVTAVFPYTFGPQFRGELADNAMTDCGGAGGAGGGPGGPPPGAQGRTAVISPDWTEVDRDNVTGF